MQFRHTKAHIKWSDIPKKRTDTIVSVRFLRGFLRRLFHQSNDTDKHHTHDDGDH